MLRVRFVCEIHGEEEEEEEEELDGSREVSSSGIVDNMTLTLTRKEGVDTIVARVEAERDVFLALETEVENVDGLLQGAVRPRRDDGGNHDKFQMLCWLVQGTVDNLNANPSTFAAVFDVNSRSLHFMSLLEMKVVEILALVGFNELDLETDTRRIQARFDELRQRCERAERTAMELGSLIRTKKPGMLTPQRLPLPPPSPSQQLVTTTQPQPPRSTTAMVSPRGNNNNHLTSLQQARALFQ